MATIKEVKTKIKNANALGVANLTEKGVEVEANATTYEIMKAISEIVGGGGGVTYTNIVYNEDNTITLTDKDGVIHTMECEYTEGKLTSVKYDGKAVELTYDDDVLVKIGKTAVDFSNAQSSGIQPLDHTVKFMVDGEPYEVVSVKDGNQVNEPTEPKKEGLIFTNWNDSEGNLISFPITPTEDTIISTTLSEKPDYSLLISALYDKLGISYSNYDQITIRFDPSDKQVSVYIGGGNNYVSGDNIKIIGSSATPVYYGYANSDLIEPTLKGMLEFAINTITFQSDTSSKNLYTPNKDIYANYTLSNVNCLSFTVFDDYMSS